MAKRKLKLAEATHLCYGFNDYMKGRKQPKNPRKLSESELLQL